MSYIEAENPRAAVHVDEQIANGARRLLDFPDSGPPGRVAGTRELVIPRTSYVAAYLFGTVRILRVLHGAQMWPDELTDDDWRHRTVSCDQLDGQVSICCLYRSWATISTLQALVSRACRTNKGLGRRLERDRSFRHTLWRWKRPLLDFNRAAFLLVHFSSGRDGLSAERSQHGLSPLQDAPRPVASAPGRLAQAELGDQVLGSTGSDLEFRRDHARRDDRPRQHVVEESRQF